MADLQPYWPFIVMGINGLIAGCLASVILGGGGLIRDVFVGILGAFLGGVLVRAGVLHLPDSVMAYANLIPHGPQILISTIGALLIIILARIVGR
jgi:uncharacterized membrane protein YeaQ/YmgE (transglycosylase-associated protein family)